METHVGRVVYDRPKHYFTMQDLVRILRSFSLEELDREPGAIGKMLELACISVDFFVLLGMNWFDELLFSVRLDAQSPGLNVLTRLLEFLTIRTPQKMGSRSRVQAALQRLTMHERSFSFVNYDDNVIYLRELMSSIEEVVCGERG